jgi:hypothetical protein
VIRERGGPAAIVLVAFTVSACAPAPPSPSQSATASAVSTAVASPATTPVVPSGSESSPAGAVPIEPSLLDVLPPQVDGLSVVRTDEALADALADPGLVAFADAVAAALAADPATGEFVYATVVRPRAVPPADEILLDWRDSFDEGVCAQAGGVSGTAEADIGGRPVFIGSCAGGVRTYHAWLGNRGVFVSVSSVGERRLGEQLVEGLRD